MPSDAAMHPRTHTLAGALGTDFGESLRSVPSLLGDKRHSFETARTPSKFPMQGFNFQCAELEILMTWVIMTLMKRKG